MPLTPTRKLKRGVTVSDSKVVVTDSSSIATTSANLSAAELDRLKFKGADIASATTTNIGAATGDFISVTGTTTITGLGTVAAGIEREVSFTGVLTLTHNATSLILPTAANITTAADDCATFRSLGSGNWICTKYSRKSGSPVGPSVLANWTESGGTYSGQEFAKFVPSSATADVHAIIQPKGTGAFQLQQSDGTATGGNNRGANAVDLTTARNFAAEVASGQYSFAVGQAAKATGQSAVALGGGSEATALGATAIHGGTASGSASFAVAGKALGFASYAFGFYAYSDVAYKFAFNSGGWYTGSAGEAPQLGLMVVSNLTTDATQSILYTDQTYDGVCSLRNNSTFAFSIIVAARRTDATGENDAWEFKGLIHRDANAASTTLDALQENKIGATAWAVTVDADTADGSLRIRVTGESAKTIRWAATIHTTEVAQ